MNKKLKEVALHEKDTGSSEAQIALLTDKIENLSAHMKKFKQYPKRGSNAESINFALLANVGIKDPYIYKVDSNASWRYGQLLLAFLHGNFIL